MIYKLESEGVLVLDRVIVADNFSKRLKGLLGSSGLNLGEGLVIKPCNSVHTIGMKFTIDVAFVDKNNIVIKVIHSLKPGKLSPIVKGSAYVVEASGGAFEGKLKTGDKIELIKGAGI